MTTIVVVKKDGYAVIGADTMHGLSGVNFTSEQILEDGSKWEVDEVDAMISSMWDEADMVMIIGGEMYKLDEMEKVAVTGAVEEGVNQPSALEQPDLLEDLITLDISDGSLDGKIGWL